MNTITSTQNPLIKTLKTLKNKKGREKENLFIAEGEKCALEAMANAEVPYLLSVDSSTPAAVYACQNGIPTYIVPEHIIAALSEAKTPQGSLAVVRHSLHTIPPSPGFYVALEHVQDPKNVGSIIRTADAVGASAVILSENCADYTAPQAIRASMGSIFHLPIVQTPDFIHTISSLKAFGVTLLAAHLKGTNQFPKTKNICILIGNESKGLSPAVSEIADVQYRIPMPGKAESLNASVAAGVLMYHVISQIF